ncbi:MAG: glycosyltransferase [Bacteroidales bacterium]
MTGINLNIGIIHSLIGKNDGVSIVIDQTVEAMIKDMGINLGNFFFLAAHSSPRFNAETDEIFWHKNDIHKKILTHFSTPPPDNFESEIHEHALYAKSVIKKWVEKNDIDLIIAHNTSHTYNFITAVGLGYYFEELRNEGIIWPKIMVWWHDSWFEREIFSKPNNVIQKFLKYLPGVYLDAILFINKSQIELGKRFYEKFNNKDSKRFFDTRTAVVPNTSNINWNWKEDMWNNNQIIHPPADRYNDTFFKDIGLIEAIQSKNFELKDTTILLQHTRVVPRKKIEVAIDFAFELEKEMLANNSKKCVVLLVSGHSGDEQSQYKQFLIDYQKKKEKENPQANVFLIFGEDSILSHRDIIVDKKYYKFSEIPDIISKQGGLGTYFSEIEGFGNNLLEMISSGLPVAINKYQVYKDEIEEYGFILPAIENCLLDNKVIKESFKLLDNINYRNQVVYHNLNTIEKKLGHEIISKKLVHIIKNIFTRTL